MSTATEIKENTLGVISMMVKAEEKFHSINKKNSSCFIYTFKDSSTLELNFFTDCAFAT